MGLHSTGTRRRCPGSIYAPETKLRLFFQDSPVYHPRSVLSRQPLIQSFYDPRHPDCPPSQPASTLLRLAEWGVVSKSMDATESGDSSSSWMGNYGAGLVSSEEMRRLAFVDEGVQQYRYCSRRPFYVKVRDGDVHCCADRGRRLSVLFTLLRECSDREIDLGVAPQNGCLCSASDETDRFVPAPAWCRWCLTDNMGGECCVWRTTIIVRGGRGSFRPYGVFLYPCSHLDALLTC